MRMDGGSKCHLNRAMIPLFDDQNIPSTLPDDQYMQWWYPTVWRVQMAPIKLYRGANWGRDADYRGAAFETRFSITAVTGFWQVNLFQNKGPALLFFLRGFISGYLYWLHLELAMQCGGGQMNGDYKYHPGRLSIATCVVITPNFYWTNHQLRLNWPASTFICIPAYHPIPPFSLCQWNQFIFITLWVSAVCNDSWRVLDVSFIWLTANCYHAKVCVKALSIPCPFLTHSLHFVASWQ